MKENAKWKKDLEKYPPEIKDKKIIEKKKVKKCVERLNSKKTNYTFQNKLKIKR